MNILFNTAGMVDPQKGGTERATVNVAREFVRQYGWKCFSIYERLDSQQCDPSISDSVFWQINRNDDKNIDFLSSIIRRWKIDVVIVQGSFIHVSRFKRAANESGCKVILAHHFEPGAEAQYFTLKSIFQRNITNWRQGARAAYDALLFPLRKKQVKKALSESYRQAAKTADAVVLLSKVFIRPFCDFAGIDTIENKFTIIPNALTFPSSITPDAIQRKNKTVLIVSRLEETHKRISLALLIWEQIKRDFKATDWTLKIVGEGADRNRYEKMVERKKIPDVEFVGRQAPLSFYEEASIFMMTSRSESWGLTLTESQQNGVVPVAFNSYPSLTDIITDGTNGIIIPEGNTDLYIKKLLNLMADTSLRHRLALNGLISCCRFSTEEIINRWKALLLSVCSPLSSTTNN